MSEEKDAKSNAQRQKEHRARLKEAKEEHQKFMNGAVRLIFALRNVQAHQAVKIDTTIADLPMMLVLDALADSIHAQNKEFIDREKENFRNFVDMDKSER